MARIPPTRILATALAAGALFSLAACSSTPPDITKNGTGGSGGAGGGAPQGDPFDIPLAGISAEQQKAFFDGDNLFGLPLHDADGLGPLYTRSSCGACHTSGVRGPGSVQKMSIVLADGVTTAADQSKLAFGHTVHPLLTAGAKTPILPPPNDPTVKVTLRVGPPILGRGYLEAILDSEIVRVEGEQKLRTDAIHG